MRRGHVAARPQYLMSLCSNGLGEHVGERPERSSAGLGLRAEAGVGGRRRARTLYPDGGRGAGKLEPMRAAVPGTTNRGGGTTPSG